MLKPFFVKQSGYPPIENNCISCCELNSVTRSVRARRWLVGGRKGFLFLFNNVLRLGDCLYRICGVLRNNVLCDEFESRVWYRSLWTGFNFLNSRKLVLYSGGGGLLGWSFRGFLEYLDLGGRIPFLRKFGSNAV